MVDSFHLLDYLDEQLGHQIWYLALYLLFLLYFSSCFYTTSTDRDARCHKSISSTETKRETASQTTRPRSLSAILFSVLLSFSVLHEWYAVTEAQVVPHFVGASLAMIVLFVWHHQSGERLDPNGLFLLLRTLLTSLLVAVWVALLWKDSALRAKYRGNWLFIPEPWSYVSLHFMNQTH